MAGKLEIMKFGKHTVSCGSATDADFPAMLAGRKANVLYSDPPWSDGNLKFWARLCKKQAGYDVNTITYDYLLQTVKRLISRHVDGYVFLEVGVKQSDMVEAFLKPFLQNVKRHEVLYRGGSGGRPMLPNILFSANTPGHAPFAGNLAGMSGYAIPKLCVGLVSIPGGVVIDPFCGMGYSAQAAMDSGMVFVGNELNRYRLEKTIKRLTKDAN